MKIYITDQEASDTVKDIAKALKLDIENSQNEYCLRIPKKLGSGFIKATNFESGIGVIECNYLLKQELLVESKRGIINPLKMIFNRKSSIEHEFTDNSGKRTIGRLESVITSCNAKSNHLFKIPSNQPICTFSIEINRKLFEEKIESYLADMNEDLVTVFRDVNGIKNFFYKGYFSLDVSKFMEEFSDCELDGFMKSVFLEAKTYEIFINQLQQYLDDLNTPETRKIIRKATLESIEKAVNIIKSEITSIDNVATLAKRVGLNRNTLQNGFKHVYNSSVKEFIRKHRIEMARDLLENSNLNITEITYRIGINSRSYFSKIFKKQYGITPKAYISKKRLGKAV